MHSPVEVKIRIHLKHHYSLLEKKNKRIEYMHLAKQCILLPQAILTNPIVFGCITVKFEMEIRIQLQKTTNPARKTYKQLLLLQRQ